MPSRRHLSDDACVLGIDFGTLSARAVLVEAATGMVRASVLASYPHGVMEERLMENGPVLPPQTALQDPADYLQALRKIIRAALRKSGVAPAQVIGLGTDFTSSTVLPTDQAGVPLCQLEAFRREPHAYVKLWKHHAAQPEAERINRVGAERNENFLDAYGGSYSSEWLVSKILETIRKAPRVHQAAARWIEAGDWIVWQLTGQESRSVSAAGFKGMRVVASKQGQVTEFPSTAFFRRLHPGLRRLVDTHLSARYLPPGACAGKLTIRAARSLGLPPGIPVAAGNIDAHAAVPGCGVAEPGRMVMILGTSSCHLLLARAGRRIPGVCGVVRDGVIEGLWAYEAGQAGTGDMLSWFVENAVPHGLALEARRHPGGVHGLLSERASQLRVGQSGLLALDWWNGSRSTLMDADLSGLLAGLTIQTKPHEIYRALVESMAFGTRGIIEAFSRGRVPVDEIVACGGLATKNPFLLQVFADVTGRQIRLAAATQASALGAAIFGAVAAGCHPNAQAAVAAMTRPAIRVFTPDPENHRWYRELFREYQRLHDYFGKSIPSTMKKLRSLQRIRA